MHSRYDTPSGLSVLIFFGMIILISRLVRWARLLSSGSPSDHTAPTAPRRCLWGPGRKLNKLTQTTALVRAEAELLHSTIDQVQAKHNLDQLMRELTPPAASRHVPEQLAGAAVPSLTLQEIGAVLASVDMPAELGAALFQLLQATANEKIGQ